MQISVNDIKKKDVIVTWKYSNLEKYFEEPYKSICNNFDCIVHYHVKEGWLIIQKLRYGIEKNKSVSEIIELEDTLHIRDISKLENYFYMESSLDKAIYNLLKKDLSKEYFEFNDYAQSTIDFVNNNEVSI